MLHARDAYQDEEKVDGSAKPRLLRLMLKDQRNEQMWDVPEQVEKYYAICIVTMRSDH
jgi:hypothetical protein